MKKTILLFLFSFSVLFGFSQEVTFEFDISPTTNNNDGAITAHISGVPEWATVICEKIGEGEIPIDDLHYDFETEQYDATINNLNAGDYKFVVEFDGQIFEETVSVNLASQPNPLAVNFVTINQKGSNLGQITATITTGSTEPTVTCLDVHNNSVSITSSTYTASTNTMVVVVSGLYEGDYNFTINDGTNYLESATAVSYLVNPLTVGFNVTHVLNDADAQISVTIGGGTVNSAITLKQHGTSNPISLASNFSSATAEKTAIATNLSEGVYELHVSENGFDRYSYVWIGKYGAETTLSVQPDANYGKDALLKKYEEPEFIHYKSTNYGNEENSNIVHTLDEAHPELQKSLIKFDYNGLEKSNIIESKIDLFGWYFRNQVSTGSNEIAVRRVDDFWEEHIVNWDITPLANNENEGTITSKGNNSFGNEQYTKDATITEIIKQQLSSSINNGFLLELLTDDKNRSQHFYSSDYTDPTKRPKLEVTFSLPDAKQLAILKKTIDGAFATLDSDRKLRFIYQEEYNDLDEKLQYNIYNDKQELVMADVQNSNTSITKLDVENIHHGQNRVVLNIDCCLSCGKYFVLEVINGKSEKWYLRFKTDPNDGSNGQAVKVFPQGHPCSTVGS